MHAEDFKQLGCFSTKEGKNPVSIDCHFRSDNFKFACFTRMRYT